MCAQVLRLFNDAVESGIPFGKKEESFEGDQVRETLLAAATEAIVLLKNDKSLLPLKEPRSLAVIGAAAKLAVPSGGGSAALRSTYTVSPLQAIEKTAKSWNGKVEYAEGAVAYRFMPLLDALMSQDSKTAGGLVQFYSGAPIKDWWSDLETALPRDVYHVHTTTSNCFMIDGIPYDELGPDLHCRMTTTLKPDRSGVWTFGVCSIGWARLYVDGQVVVDNTKQWAPGEAFFGMGSEEARGSVKLEAGRSYKLEIRQYFDPDSGVPSPFLPRNAFRAGGYPDIDEKQAIEEAVQLARKSEGQNYFSRLDFWFLTFATAAVVIVGTNPDWESEGFDRKNMEFVSCSLFPCLAHSEVCADCQEHRTRSSKRSSLRIPTQSLLRKAARRFRCLGSPKPLPCCMRSLEATSSAQPWPTFSLVTQTQVANCLSLFRASRAFVVH